MSDSIDFYFDFSSPYGYLAAERIDGIASKHGCTVDVATDAARCCIPEDRRQPAWSTSR